MRQAIITATLVLLAIIGTWTATRAADERLPPFVFVRDAKGQDWIIGGSNTRLAVPLYPATDDQILTVPWTGFYLVSTGSGGFGSGTRPPYATYDPMTDQGTQPACPLP